jgi:hypothetical protein
LAGESPLRFPPRFGAPTASGGHTRSQPPAGRRARIWRAATVLDHGDHPHPPATARAGQHVDRERASHEGRPGPVAPWGRTRAGHGGVMSGGLERHPTIAHDLCRGGRAWSAGWGSGQGQLSSPDRSHLPSTGRPNPPRRIGQPRLATPSLGGAGGAARHRPSPCQGALDTARAGRAPSAQRRPELASSARPPGQEWREGALCLLRPRTAKALGVAVPNAMQLVPDEVIE